MSALASATHNRGVTRGDFCRIGILPFLKNIKYGRNGQITALCPFHDDHRRSLSVNLESGVWKCHAGCGGGKATDFYSRLKGITEPEGYAELIRIALPSPHQIRDVKRTQGDDQQIVATYDYTDVDGRLLFQSVRLDPKGFFQRRPDVQGGWINNLTGIQRVLYRLPDLSKSKGPVLYLEGEKDVDNFYARRALDPVLLDVAATTNPSGAKGWRAEYARFLVGRDVISIPDNDEAGRGLAHDLARSLLGESRTSIKILNLAREIAHRHPELGAFHEGADFSDYLDLGGSIAGLLVWAKDLSPIEGGELPAESPQQIDDGLHLTRLADLLDEPDQATEWLVDGLLPKGGISLLVSKPKVGKSTAARVLCLCVAQGETFFDRPTRQGPVIYLAFEEKRAEVKFHFRTMGAKREADVHVLIERAPRDAVKRLEVEVNAHKPALVVIDPIFKFVRVQDANDYIQVTSALEDILAMARSTGTHILMTHHSCKVDRDGGDSVLGSTAIFGAVDTALIERMTERYRTIRSIQRYGADLVESIIQYDEETGLVSLGASREQAEEGRLEDEILKHLRTEHLPVTEDKINREVVGRRSVRMRALRMLFDKGMVQRTGSGKKGDPFVYTASENGLSSSQPIAGYQKTRNGPTSLIA